MVPCDLLDAARAARELAYAPYSRFRVGAALRTPGGRIHAGCNVENAAFPLGQCAEAGAIAAMIAAGERQIVEIAVVGSGGEPCAPCGGCRQRLAEFAGSAVPVHMAGTGAETLTSSLGELLPLTFRLAAEGLAPAIPTSAVDILRARAPGPAPLLGLVLGSGLGAIADAIEPAAAIAYGELPGFPVPTTAGHQGRVILGRLAGVPVACLQGRVHLYEGHPAAAVLPLVRTLMELGCRALILTNAAGSLRAEHGPGSLVLVEDHINLTGQNPLAGRNDEAVGPRFPDMSAVYDRPIRRLLAEAGARLGLPLGSGVYLAVLGPSFETPAEIRAYRALGADLVGMSTVPEAIAARHAGLRVAAVSLVTNLAAGMAPGELSHAETLEQSAGAADRLRRLFESALPEIARELA